MCFYLFWEAVTPGQFVVLAEQEHRITRLTQQLLTAKELYQHHLLTIEQNYKQLLQQKEQEYQQQLQQNRQELQSQQQQLQNQHPLVQRIVNTVSQNKCSSWGTLYYCGGQCEIGAAYGSSI